MTEIGGFFELEIGAGGAPYHEHALALSSGRACLRRILEEIRPRRVWAPFYVCDSVLLAIRKSGFPVEYYPLDPALDPLLPGGAPAAGECAIYVNYFGLKRTTAASLAAALGSRAIIDDTHDFFERGHTGGARSFNSARKFFGVPDGAYAYGVGGPAGPPRAPAHVHYDHLVNRLLGRQQQAFQQYRESEACVTDEPVAMSRLAERLLAGVDYEAARRIRRENFLRLHDRFGSRNQLPLDNLDAGSGPFCYPLLVDRPVAWEWFWDRGIFLPVLWPEIADRPPAGAFEWERKLAAHVLPLPVDQRYGPGHMDTVARAVDEAMAW